MGSSINGFGLRRSDLDFCLTFKGYRIEDIDVKGRIRQICRHLQRYEEVHYVFGIYSAKIPLVKFIHRKSGLSGDISLYNLLAIQNTKLLKAYSMIDKRARILGSAMKLLSKNGEIADTALRSLSSYSYIIMVIHFLQHTDPPILPALQELPQENSEPHVVEGCDVSFFNDLYKLDTVWKHQKNNQSVGELWLQLLKYYTEDFDRQCVITIRNSQKPSEENPTGTTARLFNIQDPFIVSKNLGTVMSEAMSFRTSKTLMRARKRFSQPIEQFPVGFKDYVDYFFDPTNLTDGRISKAVECNYCGKIGHTTEKCVRLPNRVGRGRGHLRIARNVNGR